MRTQEAMNAIESRTAQALTRLEIERRAWIECHADYIGVIDGRPAMLYLNPATGGTELWPVSQIPTEYLMRVIV